MFDYEIYGSSDVNGFADPLKDSIIIVDSFRNLKVLLVLSRIIESLRDNRISPSSLNDSRLSLKNSRRFPVSFKNFRGFQNQKFRNLQNFPIKAKDSSREVLIKRSKNGICLYSPCPIIDLRFNSKVRSNQFEAK